MKTVRLLCALLLTACVSEDRDNPLDGNITEITAAPEITRVTPQKGPPGTKVILKGKNFGAADASVELLFGKALTTPTSRSLTEIAFVVPPTMPAGVADVALTIDGEAAEPVTFAVAPSIDKLSRQAGYPGMHVTLNGAAFGGEQGTGRVSFGSADAEILSWADGQIEVKVPALQTAGSGGPPGGDGASAPAADVTVMAGGVASAPAEFAMFSAVPGTRCALPCNTPGSYTTMQKDGMPDPRQYHSAVWTGTELIVWGGQLASPLRTGTECAGDGARYNPATDAWTPVQAAGAPAARCRHVGVWSGTKLLVTGGIATTANEYAVLADGAAYQPSADAWSALPAMPHTRGEMGTWSGSRLVVWGGSPAAGAVTSAGSVYNPVDDTVIATDPAPGGLTGHTAVAGGGLVYVWGGSDATGLTNAGYVLYPSATPPTWSVITTVGAPSARAGHAAVYSRGRMIIYGGANGSTFYSDGKEYLPGSDVWQSMTYGGGVATGSVYFGVGDAGTALIAAMSPGIGFNGFSYDPNTGAGSALNSMNGPAPQSGVTLTWMDGSFAVFGGIPFTMQ